MVVSDKDQFHEQTEQILKGWRDQGREINADLVEAVAAALRKQAFINDAVYQGMKKENDDLRAELQESDKWRLLVHELREQIADLRAELDKRESLDMEEAQRRIEKRVFERLRYAEARVLQLRAVMEKQQDMVDIYAAGEAVAKREAIAIRTLADKQIEDVIRRMNGDRVAAVEEQKQLDELQHQVAKAAGDCGVPHDNDFDASETLDRIVGFYADLRAEVDRLQKLDVVQAKAHNDNLLEMGNLRAELESLKGGKDFDDQTVEMVDRVVRAINQPVTYADRRRDEIEQLKAQIETYKAEAVELRAEIAALAGLRLENERLNMRVSVVSDALQQISQWGAKFDAKGLHSERVVNCARSALAKLEKKP